MAFEQSRLCVSPLNIYKFKLIFVLRRLLLFFPSHSIIILIKLQNSLQLFDVLIIIVITENLSPYDPHHCVTVSKLERTVSSKNPVLSVSRCAAVMLANISSAEFIKKLNIFPFAKCVGQTEAKNTPHLQN